MQALLDDKILTESLGHEFVDRFVAGKYHEMMLQAEAKAKGSKKDGSMICILSGYSACAEIKVL